MHLFCTGRKEPNPDHQYLVELGEWKRQQTRRVITNPRQTFPVISHISQKEIKRRRERVLTFFERANFLHKLVIDCKKDMSRVIAKKGFGAKCFEKYETGAKVCLSPEAGGPWLQLS